MTPSTWQKLRTLTRPPDGMVCGVCAAFGEATPLPAWIWRVLFCVTFLTGGFGAVAYLVLAVCIPKRR